VAGLLQSLAVGHSTHAGGKLRRLQNAVDARAQI